MMTWVTRLSKRASHVNPDLTRTVETPTETRLFLVRLVLYAQNTNNKNFGFYTVTGLHKP